MILLGALLTAEGILAQGEWNGLEAAQKRIEGIRMSNIVVEVVDATGQLLQANVHVMMKRHRFAFGSAINAKYAFSTNGILPESEQYLDMFKRMFNMAVLENSMKWPRMLNEDGTYNTEDMQKLDRCINWLKENNIQLRGHNVLWPSWENMPKSMKKYEPHPKQLRSVLDKRIVDAVTRFKGQLCEWDLVNEPVHHRDVLNIFGEEELAHWYKLAEKIDPETHMYINQWYALNGTYHEGYLCMIENLVKAGAPVEGIGLQGHLNVEHFTDPAEVEKIWSKLNQYAEFGLPIKITEFDINGDKGEELQAEAIGNALTLFFSHPAVNGIMIWGFWDGRHWRSNEQAGLWNKDWTEKMAAKVWQQRIFYDWWTDESGSTDTQSGTFETRGFIGEYEVTVESGTRSKTVVFSSGSETNRWRITLE